MDRSNVTLDRLRTFARVVERGNMTAVARDLGVGQSTVTRQLRELEEAVGVPLLSRTTRRAAVTDEGRRYYAQAIEILHLVERAGEDALYGRGTPAGSVRLSCTAALGVRHIARLIFAFQDVHRDIGIDLSLSDERIDLVREGADLAIRLGPLNDSSLKLRRLGVSRRLLVASPAYLATHGRPLIPDHLSAHEGIRMSNVSGSDRIVLRGPDGKEHAAVFGGRLRVDHGLAAREALLAGRGLGPAHRWLVDDLLADGRLDSVLPDYTLPPVPLNMLIVPERAAVARVRLLAAFLTEQIGRIPGLEA
ncbi:LysR family transcriptional regulator [Lichenibacterium minor]|uniref:LysR family transcriptional regulator n=1 Tax=Lichenibacterium minor TaxID=2316528 RepID=A0A4Q2UAW6_9HYPH|nr:LysR family transcriptional regulator [Lichenibacterium minor]RYC33790.1 LysR family transcriptional regulator [Lichenibacterium minor]